MRGPIDAVDLERRALDRPLHEKYPLTLMKKVKMHSGCKGQEDVAIGVLPPPAPPCRCKKQIDYAKANELVKTGQASWVIIAKTPFDIEVECPMCAGLTDVEKKTCSQCRGKGKVTESREIPKYNEDVVLLSSVSVDPKNKKYRWNTRSKTPRVATIEAKHIKRAYVDNLKYAAQRIEEYRTMIQESLGDFGAELRTTDPLTAITQIVKPGNPEPENVRISYPPGSITFRDGSKNKTWWWKIEGRDNDYGRTV